MLHICMSVFMHVCMLICRLFIHAIQSSESVYLHMLALFLELCWDIVTSVSFPGFFFYAMDIS